MPITRRSPPDSVLAESCLLGATADQLRIPLACRGTEVGKAEPKRVAVCTHKATEPVQSEACRGCAGDAEQSENDSTLSKTPALHCCTHVTGRARRRLTVARAGLLAARSLGAKVPTDVRVKHP